MKKIYYLLFALVFIWSCKAKHEYPACFEKLNGLHVFVHYEQPVNGYMVRAICTPYDYIMQDGTTEILGKAILCFEKEGDKFYIINEYFSDSTLYSNKRQITDGMTVSVESAPYYFRDIDFDGEEELIIMQWEGMAYHGHHSYAAYKLSNRSEGKFIYPMQEPPFNQLNDYTEIDSINKTITIPFDIGIRMGGKLEYGLVERPEFDYQSGSVRKIGCIILSRLSVMKVCIRRTECLLLL